MKFPFFASFIVFILWLTFALNISKRKNNEAQESFWEKEAQANNVRKKSLDDLPYVRFPFDKLPPKDSFSEQDAAALESLAALHALKDKPIVNLSGLTNTELKLKYGTGNLTLLSGYDENFEQLCINAYKLSQALDEACRTDEALALSEEMIVCGTDISGHYKLLARIYQRRNEKDSILSLKERAALLHSLSKTGIISFLDEILSRMA